MSGARDGCLLTHSEICSVTSDLLRQKLLVVKAVAVSFCRLGCSGENYRLPPQTFIWSVIFFGGGVASKPVNNTPPFRSVTSVHTSNKRARMFSRRFPTRSPAARGAAGAIQLETEVVIYLMCMDLRSPLESGLEVFCCFFFLLTPNKSLSSAEREGGEKSLS